MSYSPTRRSLIEGMLATGSIAAFAQTSEEKRVGTVPSAALRLAQTLNRIHYGDLPPATLQYAKVLLASTLASAASGKAIGSARIIRDLAKEQGGKPESRLWFDGAQLPANLAARVNAMASDAAASDDSDLRNVAHTGTCLTAVGLALAERTGASPQDLL